MISSVEDSAPNMQNAWTDGGGYDSPSQHYFDGYGRGYETDAGIRITGKTALMHTPVWQAVNIIAGDIGQIPIRLVRDKFEDQENHPAWQLLRTRPNELQTPAVFKETVMQWALLWGNCVVWVEMRGARPVNLIPLRPDYIHYDLVDFDGRQEMIYNYYSPTSGFSLALRPEDVIHIRGLTYNGVEGYPVFGMGKNTIAHGMALQQHGNQSFRNGARPSGVLRAPGKMDPEARRNLRDDWERAHAGSDNSGRVAVLWEGLEFQQLAMSNTDAQWLESKRLNRQEVASLFNLPAYKLNSQEDGGQRADVEEQNAEYVQGTLTRWFTHWSEELASKLLRSTERRSGRYRFVWDSYEFLLGDVKSTIEIAQTAVMSSLMSPNEARERYLGLPPYEGGDEYGSPAINPRETEAGAMAPQTDGDEPAVNAHRDLLLDRVKYVIGREQSALRDAAANSKDFAAWCEAYYLGSDSRPSKIMHQLGAAASSSIEACESIGLPAAGLYHEMKRYAEGRCGQLEQLSSLTPGTRAQAVADHYLKPPEVAAGIIVTRTMGGSSEDN